MKKNFLILIVLFFTLAASAQNDIVVDPNASARQLTGSFTAIKISDGIDLILSQSDNIAVAVSAADEKIKAGIKTIIENGTLKIYYEGEKLFRKRNRKLRAYVSFKELTKINALGACDIVVVGTLTGDALLLKLSGACDFKGAVKLTTLKVDISGASDVWISGSAQTVDIENSGASDFRGYGLVSDYCTANSSGASDVNITVNKEISVKATGASDFLYKGDALIKEKQNSGASSVERKNKR